MIFVAALFLLLAILKPVSVDAAFVAAFFFQIFVPVKLGYEPVWNLERSDLIRVIWVSILTFSLYGIGFWLLQNHWAHSRGYEVSFVATWDWKLLLSFVTNLFLVALPEEIFYRGFLQKYRGMSIIFVNVLFAVGHFIGEYDPFRLLPFFPGLVFSWFVLRSGGSLLGATIYHALCNVFSEWLAAGFHWSR